MKDALLYEQIDEAKVKCRLCSHYCTVPEGGVGICRVRKNIGGKFFSLNSDLLIAASVDPIEKKPLFHVAPASHSYSIACPGCNFRCLFCQNWEIAQEIPKRLSEPGFLWPNLSSKDSRYSADPEKIVENAIATGSRSISYTYTEPTVFFELVFPTSRIASEKGLRNIMVTNGFMSSEALEMISPFLDAANVDLKAYDDGFYKKYCGSRLEPVKNTLRLMKKKGVWVEVTTLLIPGLNDGRQNLSDLASFIAEELGPETPWHISRFYPQFKMTDRPPTSPELIKEARQIGLDKGLKYVYSGNLPGDEGESTFCSSCGETIVRRIGYRIDNIRIKNSACMHCGVVVEGLDLP